VLIALVSKLLIIILQYLAGLLLPVEKVLQISVRSLQLIYSSLKLCNQQSTAGQTTSRPPISTQQDNGVPLFLLRRDLFFRTKSSLFTCISWTSLWYLETAVSSFDCMAAACFRLHELLLQHLGPKHRVAVPLKHLRLRAGPLSDVLHRQHGSNGYSTLKD
jgi:hypothetical protein